MPPVRGGGVARSSRGRNACRAATTTAFVVAGRQAAVGRKRGVVFVVQARRAGPGAHRPVAVVVDKQRDAGRRQFLGQQVFSDRSAGFERVRLVLLGHGPGDEYPGRPARPRVLQYPPDERVPVDGDQPVRGGGSGAVTAAATARHRGGVRRVRPPDRAVIVDIAEAVVRVVGLGAALPPDVDGLGHQAHVGRPPAEQRHGHRADPTPAAAGTATAGGHGHGRQRRPTRPARRRRPGLDLLVHLALGHHLPPVVLVRLLQQLVLDAVKEPVAQRRTGDEGERQRLDGRVRAWLFADGGAQRLVQRYPVVRQVERGQRSDYLEHRGERVVPAQLVGHGRGQEERVPLMGYGHLGRQGHFEYRRSYPVPVIPGDGEHLQPK